MKENEQKRCALKVMLEALVSSLLINVGWVEMIFFGAWSLAVLNFVGGIFHLFGFHWCYFIRNMIYMAGADGPREANEDSIGV